MICKVYSQQLHLDSSLIDDIPGDKSMSHRAVILGALADNTSVFKHFLRSEDCLNTASIFRQLGVSIEDYPDEDKLVVHGVGLHGLKVPSKPLDVGNSGTGIRLITGVLAGQSFDCEISGDASIQKRPMRRVVDPLKSMGARIEGVSLDGKDDIYPPLRISGASGLQAIRYRLPVASAQVKSALLLAGLFAQGTTIVEEPEACRNHTELMLAGYGADFSKDGTLLSCSGARPLHNGSDEPLVIPGDFSSAAFFIVLGLILEDSELRISGISLNETRSALLDVLIEMGGNIRIENRYGDEFEPYGDIVVKSSSLTNVTVSGDVIPFLIDEVPILAIAGLFGSGELRIRDAEELKVKESDRITTTGAMIEALGGSFEAFDDGLSIRGGVEPTSGTPMIDSFGDHRIAMSAIIGALGLGSEVQVNSIECINTSFPNFFDIVSALGASYGKEAA